MMNWSIRCWLRVVYVFVVSLILIGLILLKHPFQLTIQEDEFSVNRSSEQTSAHWYSGVAIETVTEFKGFIYYDGFESSGGNMPTYLHICNYSLKTAVLCRNTVGCIGFNTQGLLKDTLLPFINWTRLESTGGLYVLDVDYCNFTNGHRCPLDSYCLSISKGRYTCGLREVVDNVHVVISVDKKESQGLLPLLQSLKEHHTKYLQVHIVISKMDRIYIEKNIFCGISSSESFKIDTVPFDAPDHVMKLVRGLKKGRRYLKSSGNFARFYFDQLFPNLTQIIYLDVDTIVVHDIWELWKKIVATEKLLVVIPRNGEKLLTSLTKKIKKPFKERYGKDMNLNTTSFNAGVFGLNLKKWKERELIKEVLYWMEANNKYHIWSLGTQPLMQVVFYEDWEYVSSHWNVEGLGAPKKVKNQNKIISNGYLLHWNGPFKPWLKNGKHKIFWEKYNYGLCSGSGKCVTDLEGNDGICKCDEGFQGDLCENKLDM